jgi:hypothetical protein
MNVAEARAALDPHVDHANALAEWFQQRGLTTYDGISVFMTAICTAMIPAGLPFDVLCEAVGNELGIAYMALTTPGLELELETVDIPPTETRTLQ